MRRSIARCYNEHAVKVSDSYCSGPTNRRRRDPTIPSSIQTSVTCVYESTLLITLTWHAHGTHRLVLKDPDSVSPLVVYKFQPIKKGSASFKSHNGSVIEIFWDLSKALRDVGPEPVCNFYVLVVVDHSDVVLRLGDLDMDAAEGFCMKGCRLVSRCEFYEGSAVYKTRVRFCETGVVHKIGIMCEREGRVPVLTVSVDERKVIRVERLMWNFRGNEPIFVDGVMVDMMWDVHDWFFNAGESGFAVFMFRTRNGNDGRLWMEENLLRKEMGKAEISFLICASAFSKIAV